MKKINDKLAINTLRVLSACAITKAKSGHPGIALGAAPIMYDLFAHQMNVSPTAHEFYNRDRFVLSAGHASSLLYSTMLLCGYDNITMEDLMSFRQLGSKTPGHPEPELLNSVEVSSGPLGQGVAMAVGFAIASKKVANLVNTPKHTLINNKVYCLFGDGCFEEGISYEALSIAGRLGLDNLIMIYDYNSIQLDGKVSDSTIIDTKKYFTALGWDVLECKEDYESVHKTLTEARSAKRPVVVLAHTTIGFGSDLAGSNKSHGSPLNAEQIINLKKNLKFDYPDFTIPVEIGDVANHVKERTDKEISRFNKELLEIKNTNPEHFAKVENICIKQQMAFDEKWFDPKTFAANEATRNIAGTVLQTIAAHNPTLMAMIADLQSSTKIGIKNSNKIIKNNWGGQNLDCGVREFAMGAMINGYAAFGGTKAIGSTFMSFSDYNKAAIRLAAISKVGAVNVYSHDSITVGEDGPTHQPIEQLWTLRHIPNHMVFRPCSTIDTIVAYEYAMLSKQTPVSIITSRSNFDQINVDYKYAKRGGYVIYHPAPDCALTIYATGSEVATAIEVAKHMKTPTRVVAINSLELLMQQDKKYLSNIFDGSKKVSIEFGITTPWYKYVDLAIGVDQFGYSGKPNDVINKLGLSVDQIVARITKHFHL